MVYFILNASKYSLVGVHTMDSVINKSERELPAPARPYMIAMLLLFFVTRQVTGKNPHAIFNRFLKGTLMGVPIVQKL